MQELEQECDRYKTVIHKLSNKVEAANAAGIHFTCFTGTKVQILTLRAQVLPILTAPKCSRK